MISAFSREQLTITSDAISPDIPYSRVGFYNINFTGIAPKLGLNLNLSDRVLLFADIRLRTGRVYLDLVEKPNLKDDFKQDDQYWKTTLDLVNSVGVKVRL